MKIAVIGWGSLVWDPRDLALATGEWQVDGPLLPIEFARISRDGRLTLVIYPGAELQPALWAESDLTDLAAARENLRAREGEGCAPSFIHAFKRGGKTPGSSSDATAVCAVSQWLDVHCEFGAAIWTGLGARWPARLKEEFGSWSEAAALLYLKKLKADCRHKSAEAYIRRAPRQIDTALRRSVESELGWTWLSVAPEVHDGT